MPLVADDLLRASLVTPTVFRNFTSGYFADELYRTIKGVDCPVWIHATFETVRRVS